LSRVTKHAPAALVALVLVATGLSFLYVESLKLEPSPIRGTRVTKVFSPVCRCDSSKARISFRVGKPDAVAVSIVDAAGRDVRDLAFDRTVTTRPVAFLWNGRDNEGAVVRDGFYRPRVRLDLLEKTFALPNPIQVDTKAPRVTVVSVNPRVISPDGDRRADRVDVSFRVDESAQASLLVSGVQRVLGRRGRLAGQLRWYGQIDGKALAAGIFDLAVGAVDAAGNQSHPVAAGSVRIRYVELAKKAFRVRANGRLVVPVSADAVGVTWRLAGRHGSAAPPILRLRAPASPGTYALYVIVRGHAARARVTVVP
jgi:hypothetical protein